MVYYFYLIFIFSICEIYGAETKGLLPIFQPLEEMPATPRPFCPFRHMNKQKFQFPISAFDEYLIQPPVSVLEDRAIASMNATIISIAIERLARPSAAKSIFELFDRSLGRRSEVGISMDIDLCKSILSSQAWHNATIKNPELCDHFLQIVKVIGYDVRRKRSATPIPKSYEFPRFAESLFEE